MRYAILGIGQVGLRHFEAFSKIKKLKLIGFIETNVERANSFEKQFKIKHKKHSEMFDNNSEFSSTFNYVFER